MKVKGVELLKGKLRPGEEITLANLSNCNMVIEDSNYKMVIEFDLEDIRIVATTSFLSRKPVLKVVE